MASLLTDQDDERTAAAEKPEKDGKRGREFLYFL
jgi:hypothetical protein